MKVALFGRTGLIGSNIANVLLQRNISFIGISRSQSSSDTIPVDWSNAQSLDNIPTDVTAAIICSSKLPQKTYTATDISEFIKANVLGLINILEWAKHRNIKQIVYCSTLSMIPKNVDGFELIDTQAHYPYKISKAAAEHLLSGYCRESRINHIILRIASVYGPGMKPDVIHAMITTAMSGGVFTLNNRSAEADFVHVSDVALAAVESLTSNSSEPVINVTSGKPVKLIDLWGIIKDAVGNQQASIEIKGDTPSASTIHSASNFEKLIHRPLTGLKDGIRDLIKTYM